MDSKIKFKTIDEYINSFRPDIQIKLQQLRRTIKSVVPEVQETISYNMPAFKLAGEKKSYNNMVYFAGYKKHIGFYPTPSPIEVFEKELSVYKTSKGAIQFPLDKPLPLDLIKKLVKYRFQGIK